MFTLNLPCTYLFYSVATQPMLDLGQRRGYETCMAMPDLLIVVACRGAVA